MSLKFWESGKKASNNTKTEKEETGDLNKDILPEERKEIIEWIKNVKFPRKCIGGVDEVVVWRKISELDTLYAKLLEAERVRYNTLLKQYRNTAVKVLKELKEEKEEGNGFDGSE